MEITASIIKCRQRITVGYIYYEIAHEVHTVSPSVRQRNCSTVPQWIKCLLT